MAHKYSGQGTHKQNVRCMTDKVRHDLLWQITIICICKNKHRIVFKTSSLAHISVYTEFIILLHKQCSSDLNAFSWSVVFLQPDVCSFLLAFLSLLHHMCCLQAMITSLYLAISVPTQGSPGRLRPQPATSAAPSDNPLPSYCFFTCPQEQHRPVTW